MSSAIRAFASGDAFAIRRPSCIAAPIEGPFSLTHDSVEKAERSVSESTRQKLGEYSQEKESWKNGQFDPAFVHTQNRYARISGTARG
jgi:hypothetical protein